MQIILDDKRIEQCLVMRKIDKKLKDYLLTQKERLYLFFKRINLVSERILDAFLRVPRECFVPPQYVKYAYVDEPLPISKDATISAISMSLLLCEYANPRENYTVLEIGTGSGYQAALFAELVYPRNKMGLIREKEKLVYTTEISDEVYRFGLDNLKATGYIDFVEVKLWDGTQGWPDGDMKFDVIVITAAGDRIPEPLLKQLKVNGILLMPLGSSFWQDLIRVTRVGEGEDDIRIEKLDEVRFVPLKGRYGLR